MCSGGGGGGDGGAAARETERQARIAEGTKAVNALFGAGDATEQVATGEKTLSGYQRARMSSDPLGGMQSVTETLTPEEYASLTARSGPQSGSPEFMFAGGGAPSQDAGYEPIYSDVMQTVPSSSSGNLAARNALYDTVKGDTRNFFSSQLEEDRATARRQLDFQKARAGTAGSSQGIDMDTEFQKRYDRGLLDIANRADSAASGMRTADEQARLGLISKVASGIDQGSAVSSAMSQLKSNLDNSRNDAMTGRMANVFSDLIGGYTNGQVVAGQNAAKQQYGGTLGNYINPADSNGTVTRNF